MKKRIAVSSLIALSAALSPGALAATITDPFNLVAGTGSLSVTVSTPDPNNTHSIGPSPNTWNINEDITSFSVANGFEFNFLEPFSNGSTEYYVTKTVTNDTAFIWTDYQIGIGCGADGTISCWNDPTIDPLTLDYTAGAFTSSAGGAIGANTSAYFDWVGLNLSPGQSITFQFSLDTCTRCQGGWVMFENANNAPAPEPGTLVMLGSGGLLLGLGRLRRRRV